MPKVYLPSPVLGLIPNLHYIGDASNYVALDANGRTVASIKNGASLSAADPSANAGGITNPLPP